MRSGVLRLHRRRPAEGLSRLGVLATGAAGVGLSELRGERIGTARLALTEGGVRLGELLWGGHCRTHGQLLLPLLLVKSLMAWHSSRSGQALLAAKEGGLEVFIAAAATCLERHVRFGDRSTSPASLRRGHAMRSPAAKARIPGPAVYWSQSIHGVIFFSDGWTLFRYILLRSLDPRITWYSAGRLKQNRLTRFFLRVCGEVFRTLTIESRDGHRTRSERARTAVSSRLCRGSTKLKQAGDSTSHDVAAEAAIRGSLA